MDSARSTLFNPSTDVRAYLADMSLPGNLNDTQALGFGQVVVAYALHSVIPSVQLESVAFGAFSIRLHS
jgi:hypothetical protein